jgi:hypothetical protein
MNGPLQPVIQSLRDACSIRERTRASVREAWNDATFRSVDGRDLTRLDMESRLALTALDQADGLLQQALRLVGD